MLSKILYAVGGLALVAAGVAAAFFAGRLQPDAQPSPQAAPLVDIVRPEPVSSPPAIRESGFVRASDRVEVAPEVSGRIVEIGEGFSLGARVEEGDLLVRLESSTLETRLAQARADLNSAEAAQSQASAELMRQEELQASNVVSEAEVERVRAQAATARARVEQAQAAVNAAQLRLDETELTAPFDAVVVQEDASLGQFLSVGASIGVLVAADVAEVRAGLSEQSFRQLRRGGRIEGREVRVEVDGGETLTGTIAALAPVIEGQARTVEIVVEVADPFAEGRDLVLNALVTVVIPLPDSDEDLFRLPMGALQVGERLWRVQSDDTLEPVPADVQRRGDDDVYVTSDALSADDRILLTEIANPLPGLAVRLRGEDEGEETASNEGPGGNDG